jgi:hypothetical protein
MAASIPLPRGAVDEEEEVHRVAPSHGRTATGGTSIPSFALTAPLLWASGRPALGDGTAPMEEEEWEDCRG